MMTNEQFAALARYEENFRRAIRHNFFRKLPKADISEIYRLYGEITGAEKKPDFGCGKCILQVLKRLGGFYFEYLEKLLRENQSEGAPVQKALIGRKPDITGAEETSVPGVDPERKVTVGRKPVRKRVTEMKPEEKKTENEPEGKGWPRGEPEQRVISGRKPVRKRVTEKQREEKKTENEPEGGGMPRGKPEQRVISGRKPVRKRVTEKQPEEKKTGDEPEGKNVPGGEPEDTRWTGEESEAWPPRPLECTAENRESARNKEWKTGEGPDRTAFGPENPENSVKRNGKDATPGVSSPRGRTRKTQGGE